MPSVSIIVRGSSQGVTADIAELVRRRLRTEGFTVETPNRGPGSYKAGEPLSLDDLVKLGMRVVVIED